MSGSEDKSLCIWSTKDWECHRTLNGHKLAINTISIHHSGKLALTGSKDRTLKLWNLTNGRSAFNTVLDFEPEIIKWSPDGICYIIVSSYRCIHYSLEGEKIRDFENENFQKIVAVTFLENEIIAFGGENNKINIYDLSSGEKLTTIDDFNNRIKGLERVPKPQELINKYKHFLISLCSDRTLKIWDLDNPGSPIGEGIINGRVTCMAATSTNEE